MAKEEQTEMVGFEQKRIGQIKRAANKFDEKRSLIGGLSDELENLDYKLREVMHANEADCDHQDGPNREKLLVYKRGDFNVVVKSKESVKCKIKADSRGEEPGEE